MMIIDVHAHIFPNFKGPYGTLIPEQNMIRSGWGRFETSTLDEKYIPEPGENVDIRVGKYGKIYWTKYGKECWFRRFPAIMKEMEWPAEQMLAFMDNIGVDKAVLHAGYMELNYCRDYFAENMKRWPGRFIGIVTIDYNIEKDEEYREAELKKLRDSIHNMGMRGVLQGYPKDTNIMDDKFEPLWEEISRLKIPHIFNPGPIPTKQEYIRALKYIENILKKFPDLNGIIGHLGGNVKHHTDPNYTDTPRELMKILSLPNAYFEVGYVMVHQNWDVWKENYEYPFPLHNKIIKTIYDEVGAERLLWGSDMPNNYRVCTYRQMLDLVRLHFDFLSEEEKSLVLGGNAAKLFRV